MKPLRLPCSEETWYRLQKYFVYLRSNDDYHASDYWIQRKNDLSFIRDDDGFVSMSGYFTGPKNKIINSKNHFPSLAKNPVQMARNIKSWAFNDFILSRRSRNIKKLQYRYDRTLKPLVEQFYPGISRYVDAYNLAKSTEISLTLENLIRSGEQPTKIIEIGAGGCLVPLILSKLNVCLQYNVVDLGQMIPTGFIILSYFNPSLNLTLPNEEISSNTNVAFHLPQHKYQSRGPANIMLNVTSFQEMSLLQVEDYFSFIDKMLAPGGYFLCINRMQKETRFESYPWPNNGYTIEVDREDAISRISGNSIKIQFRLLKKNAVV
jgi:hypothetical protein